MGAINLAVFQQEALAEHNYYRQQIHCTRPMALNASLNTMAQKYAEHLAYYETFSHSGEPGVGENLWMKSSSAGISSLDGAEPTADWYSEIEDYDYSAPGFSSGTGHFTQVVWSDSIQMGIGVALSDDGQSVYSVANYYPQGNFQGEFGSKVPPVCPATTTTTTTAPTTTTSTTTAALTASKTTTTAAATTSRTTITADSTTTVSTTTSSDNSAVSSSYQYYHLLASLVILGRQFH
ncbi:hypothetical protein I4U23_016402 [Adineta vaga]|nr:hypothetical protein I4U23_016402 [Adineta vaga]